MADIGLERLAVPLDVKAAIGVPELLIACRVSIGNVAGDLAIKQELRASDVDATTGAARDVAMEHVSIIADGRPEG